MKENLGTKPKDNLGKISGIEQINKQVKELISQGELNQAASYLEGKMELQPDLAQLHLLLADIRKKQGDLHTEVHCYLQAIKLDPKLFKAYAYLRFHLLRYNSTLNQDEALLDQVINCCREVIQKNPHLKLAHTLLGYALTKQGKLKEAIATYQKISYEQAVRQKANISQGDWKTAISKLPQFVVIGAEKCGTTSIFHYLDQHPQLLLSVEKELDFFNFELSKGTDWYLAHFPPVPQTQTFLTGEVSPHYFHSVEAPQRILNLLPEVKLILLLRNPVERIISRYHMILKHKNLQHSFADQIVTEMHNVSQIISGSKVPSGISKIYAGIRQSIYINYLKKWRSLFPPEQLLVIKSEDLFLNPAATMKQIFDYLEVPNHQLATYRKYNAGSYPDIITDELRHSLREFFHPYNQELEKELGMKFNW